MDILKDEVALTEFLDSALPMDEDWIRGFRVDGYLMIFGTFQSSISGLG